MEAAKQFIALGRYDAFSLIRTEISVLFETGQKDFTEFARLPSQIINVEFDTHCVSSNENVGIHAVTLVEVDEMLDLLAKHYVDSNIIAIEQLTDDYLLSKLIQIRSIRITSQALHLASLSSGK